MDKILASLKYGRIWRKGVFLWYSMFVFGFFALCYSFVFLFGNERDLVGFIGSLCCFVVFSCTALYIIIKNFINVKKCREWMEDAVVLSATTKGIKKPLPSFTDIFLRKLEVSFKYEGKRYVKYSGTKQSNGYDRVFSRFVDKEISILYSPRFDEVMILSDE